MSLESGTVDWAEDRNLSHVIMEVLEARRLEDTTRE